MGSYLAIRAVRTEISRFGSPREPRTAVALAEAAATTQAEAAAAASIISGPPVELQQQSAALVSNSSGCESSAVCPGESRTSGLNSPSYGAVIAINCIQRNSLDG